MNSGESNSGSIPSLVGILRGEGSGPEVIEATCHVLASVASEWIAETIKDRNSLKEKLFEIDVALRFSLFAQNFDSRSACLRRICQAARRRYHFQLYRGRIDLFRTEDVAPVEFYELDPLLGWGGMVLEGVELHELSGRHGGYLREPQVGTFAELLTPSLARAQISTGRSLPSQSLSI